MSGVFPNCKLIGSKLMVQCHPSHMLSKADLGILVQMMLFMIMSENRVSALTM